MFSPEICDKKVVIKNLNVLTRKKIRKLPFKTDRWRGLVRATYAPIADPGNVWHCGFSAAYIGYDSFPFGSPFRDEDEIKPWPGLRGRNIRQILNTRKMRASHRNQFNVEAA